MAGEADDDFSPGRRGEGGGRLVRMLAVSPSGAGASAMGVAIDSWGGIYHLQAYPSLKEWKTWTLSRIQNEMKKIALLRNSDFYRLLSTFMDDAEEVERARDAKNEHDITTVEEGILSRIFSDLTAMRMITLGIMLFLVQVLVRLYQYSLRLAAFWECRGDAILLAPSFAEGKARAFDELVDAMAPDAYDFKPGPRSILNWREPWRKEEVEAPLHAMVAPLKLRTENGDVGIQQYI